MIIFPRKKHNVNLPKFKKKLIEICRTIDTGKTGIISKELFLCVLKNVLEIYVDDKLERSLLANYLNGKGLSYIPLLRNEANSLFFNKMNKSANSPSKCPEKKINNLFRNRIIQQRTLSTSSFHQNLNNSEESKPLLKYNFSNMNQSQNQPNRNKQNHSICINSLIKKKEIQKKSHDLSQNSRINSANTKYCRARSSVCLKNGGVVHQELSQAFGIGYYPKQEEDDNFNKITVTIPICTTLPQINSQISPSNQSYYSKNSESKYSKTQFTKTQHLLETNQINTKQSFIHSKKMSMDKPESAFHDIIPKNQNLFQTILLTQESRNERLKNIYLKKQAFSKSGSKDHTNNTTSENTCDIQCFGKNISQQSSRKFNLNQSLFHNSALQNTLSKKKMVPKNKFRISELKKWNCYKFDGSCLKKKKK